MSSNALKISLMDPNKFIKLIAPNKDSTQDYGQLTIF